MPTSTGDKADLELFTSILLVNDTFGNTAYLVCDMPICMYVLDYRYSISTIGYLLLTRRTVSMYAINSTTHLYIFSVFPWHDTPLR